MKITPLDIQKKTFRTVFRGLDEAEVDAFLELVAKELEDVVKENIALKEDLRRKDQRLGEHTDREQVLKDTLLMAQQLTQDIKSQARREGELLLADAEKQAERIVQDAHRRLVELIEDINELKRQKSRFHTMVRQAVESHLEMLEQFRDQPEPEVPDAERIQDNVEFFTPRRAAGDDEPEA